MSCLVSIHGRFLGIKHLVTRENPCMTLTVTIDPRILYSCALLDLFSHTLLANSTMRAVGFSLWCPVTYDSAGIRE